MSQLYDVFPEPPPGHPLFDAEGQKKMQQYRELASSLNQWIREHIAIMQVIEKRNNTHLTIFCTGKNQDISRLKICHHILQ